MEIDLVSNEVELPLGALGAAAPRLPPVAYGAIGPRDLVFLLDLAEPGDEEREDDADGEDDERDRAPPDRGGRGEGMERGTR